MKRSATDGCRLISSKASQRVTYSISTGACCGALYCTLREAEHVGVQRHLHHRLRLGPALVMPASAPPPPGAQTRRRGPPTGGPGPGAGEPSPSPACKACCFACATMLPSYPAFPILFFTQKKKYTSDETTQSNSIGYIRPAGAVQRPKLG